MINYKTFCILHKLNNWQAFWQKICRIDLLNYQINKLMQVNLLQRSIDNKDK